MPDPPSTGPMVIDPGTQGDGNFELAPTFTDAPEMTVGQTSRAETSTASP